jgi:hypothetical protein
MLLEATFFNIFSPWLDSPGGPRPPHCWGFEITPRSVGLLWSSDRPVAETSTWQLKTETHQYPRRDSNPAIPANGTAENPRLRPRGHRDRYFVRIACCKLRILTQSLCELNVMESAVTPLNSVKYYSPVVCVSVCMHDLCRNFTNLNVVLVFLSTTDWPFCLNAGETGHKYTYKFHEAFLFVCHCTRNERLWKYMIHLSGNGCLYRKLSTETDHWLV